MITEKFSIHEYHLNYYISLSKISLDKSSLTLDQIIRHFSTLERENEKCFIQVCSDNLILNEMHIFSAVFFVQKAFLQGYNISSRKNLELLLYLATDRQIKNGFKDFGVSELVERKSPVILCIVTPNTGYQLIFDDILKTLNACEIELSISSPSIDKIKRIKNYYDISDNQIRVLLKSYSICDKRINKDNSYDIHELFVSALNDIIQEKMVGLILDQ